MHTTCTQAAACCTKWQKNWIVSGDCSGSSYFTN